MSKPRCAWVPEDKPDYVAYHDTEWGVPVHDDRHLFEMLILEGAQAGLSWYTILRRRDGYRAAFKNFEPEKVARMTDAQLEKLLATGDIIRNRLKVFSTRTNARVVLSIQKEFGSLDAYVWRFVGGTPMLRRPKTSKDVPRANARIRRVIERPQEARHELRRVDDHVRVHAGNRPGERPHGGLLQGGEVAVGREYVEPKTAIVPSAYARTRQFRPLDAFGDARAGGDAAGHQHDLQL